MFSVVILYKFNDEFGLTGDFYFVFVLSVTLMFFGYILPPLGINFSK